MKKKSGQKLVSPSRLRSCHQGTENGPKSAVSSFGETADRVWAGHRKDRDLFLKKVRPSRGKLGDKLGGVFRPRANEKKGNANVWCRKTWTEEILNSWSLRNNGGLLQLESVCLGDRCTAKDRARAHRMHSELGGRGGETSEKRRCEASIKRREPPPASGGRERKFSHYSTLEKRLRISRGGEDKKANRKKKKKKRKKRGNQMRVLL